MFTIQIISVRPNQNEDRALTINTTPNQNQTVVGRLFDGTASTMIGEDLMDNFLQNNGGGRTTIVMSESIAAELRQAAEVLYQVEDSPFYLLTFEVNYLQNSINNAEYGYNMTMNAAKFVGVEKSPIDPSMLDTAKRYQNAPNHDAAMRSAEAYEEGIERRAMIQNQVVTDAKKAKVELDEKNGGRKTRKTKAAATVKE
jgi:hypothetical protein